MRSVWPSDFVWYEEVTKCFAPMSFVNSIHSEIACLDQSLWIWAGRPDVMLRSYPFNEKLCNSCSINV